LLFNPLIVSATVAVADFILPIGEAAKCPKGKSCRLTLRARGCLPVCFVKKGGGAVGVITSVEAVKQFFSTPEKPVSFHELKELGSAAIKDLARECAPALGVQLKNQTE